jgi:membrane protease YdiL (CAAX protease family)
MLDDGKNTSVRKLIFLLTALFVVGYMLPYFVQLALRPAIFQAPSSPLAVAFFRWFYPAILISYLLQMAVVIWLCKWPQLHRRTAETAENHDWGALKAGLIGTGIGLLIFLATISVQVKAARGRFFVSTVMSCPYCLSTLLFVLVVCLAIPIASELVFRGIILESFLERIGVIGAVLVSSFAFALLWPVFGMLVGSVLGIVVSILYVRTRSVVACIFADIVVTGLVSAHLICHALGIVR